LFREIVVNSIDPARLLIEAVYRGDLKEAFRALVARKVDVNAPIIGNSGAPLWFDLLAKYGKENVAFLNKKHPDKAIIALWEFIIKRAERLAGMETIGGVTMPRFNHVVINVHPDIVSLVVFAAIKQTQGQAVFDLQGLFLRARDKALLVSAENLKDRITAIHERVRASLANPVTPLEKAAAAALGKEGKAYWQHPLIFPALKPDKPDFDPLRVGSLQRQQFGMRSARFGGGNPDLLEHSGMPERGACIRKPGTSDPNVPKS
jgi:hypothetical protein